MSFHIIPASDTAIVIEFGNEINQELNHQVLAAEAAISEGQLTGIIETVPTFRSLMVHYDPLQTTAAELEAQMAPLMGTGQGTTLSTRQWHLPVCYEGAYGDDLEDVARLSDLTTDDVIKLHTAAPCPIYMIGFLPGQPYIGGLAEALSLPRRETPRVRVPRGSVAIAVGLSTIYPFESPGGWHLIGTTPVPLFDKDRAKPALFAPGESIIFQAVNTTEFKAIEASVSRGEYSLEFQEASS